ncbi:MAG: PilN domain-containing protein [Planctomycetota bacterium]
MIRINLLPEEYRKKARTPIKMLVAMGFVVAFNAGLAAWWGWTVFGIRAKVETERTTLQLEMDGLTPQVKYFHSLESESKQYKSREKTLASITSNRISWTRKLDELIDVANAGGDGSRHLVWLDDLTVTSAKDPNGKNFGSVRANGHSGSEKFAQVANFLEDLEGSAFVDDFEKPAPPEGTQTLVDDTLVPPVAWSFPLSLSLKGPEERAKGAAERLKNLSRPETPAEAEGETGTGGGTGTPADTGTEPGTDHSGKTEPTRKTDAPATPGGQGTSTQEEPR